ncbi:MAG: tetratricopeptide repeat protein [Chitinophagales bacterium]
MYKIGLYCFLVFYSTFLFAATPKEQMAKANELAAGGKYQDAIKIYETLLSEGQESCVLYYNLGNAYYKADKLSSAILQYERAKQISPKDKDILHNLKIANEQVKFPVNNLPTMFYIRWWQNIVNTFSPTLWGILCLLALWGTFAAFGLFTYRKEALVKKRSLYSGITLGVLSLFLLLFTYSRYEYRYDQSHAIVFEEEIPLQIAPSNDSEVSTSLTEGVKVTVKDQLDDWVKVSLSDGREGWITLKSIQMI